MKQCASLLLSLSLIFPFRFFVSLAAVCSATCNPTTCATRHALQTSRCDVLHIPVEHSKTARAQTVEACSHFLFFRVSWFFLSLGLGVTSAVSFTWCSKQIKCKEKKKMKKKSRKRNIFHSRHIWKRAETETSGGYAAPKRKKKSGEGAVGLKPRLTYLMCDGYSIVCVHKECALFALMRLPKKSQTFWS
jgi:hypothetical protein